ncbi:hypothetical protein CRG98_024632 [Punica granatum]|uniref:Uncharacterized protein n=1 Tax=Punica granatum TaxID=22663 RepID=A0A2I0JGC7_PUNGR|nr:hypothetical protein CRG98_024632 [Punica granatum]
MEDLLFCRDLYNPIEGDSAKPKYKDDKAWERVNWKTIGLIWQWINNSIYHHVAQETNAKALWDKLANLYARKTPQNKSFLVKKLVHLYYQDRGDMVVHGRSQSRNSSSKHGNSRDKSRGRSKSKMRKWVTCYHYGKAGHYKREYRALKRNQNCNCESKKEDDTATVTSDGKTYIVCDEIYVNLTCQDST